MTTTVFPCPKCRVPVRLREGESSVQCTGCGATVAAGAPGSAGSAGRRDLVTTSAPTAGERFRQAILVLSLLGLGVGFVMLANARRQKAARDTPAPENAPIYTAPLVVPVTPTPAGEVAWEPSGRAPIVASINADAVEDVFGFFRVWDGLSAWVVYAGAFDGVTLKEMWRSDALDPQIAKQPGVVPLALIAGPRIVVADTSPTLRVYTLATGQKQTTLQLLGPVAELCLSPDDPSRVWAKVVGEGDAMLDLRTGKSTIGPRPRWCPVPAYRSALPTPLPKRATPEQLATAARKVKEAAVCTDAFTNAVVAHASCHLPDAAAGGAGFKPAYTLTDGALAVALGTKDDKPFAESRTKANAWVHGFVTDDTKAKPSAPAVAELGLGRLYAVYEKVYFDAKVAALDARTGASLWEAPLVGSMPGPEGPGRGEARSLVATHSRVYVARAGGGLDIFDAANGKSIGTIGKH
jgi:hypothetical protein